MMPIKVIKPSVFAYSYVGRNALYSSGYAHVCIIQALVITNMMINFMIDKIGLFSILSYPFNTPILYSDVIVTFHKKPSMIHWTSI